MPFTVDVAEHTFLYEYVLTKFNAGYLFSTDFGYIDYGDPAFDLLLQEGVEYISELAKSTIYPMYSMVYLVSKEEPVKIKLLKPIYILVLSLEQDRDIKLYYTDFVSLKSRGEVHFYYSTDETDLWDNRTCLGTLKNKEDYKRQLAGVVEHNTEDKIVSQRLVGLAQQMGVRILEEPSNLKKFEWNS